MGRRAAGDENSTPPSDHLFSVTSFGEFASANP
jgi:hypothetical protein